MTSLQEASRVQAAFAPEMYESARSVRRMGAVAFAFLETLSPTERARAMFDFNNESERRDWDFIPKFGRLGMPLKEMSYRQRQLAQQLLATGLNISGYVQARTIMAFEDVLRELNTPQLGLVAGDFRTSENYFFSFFGQPQSEQVWGWRMVGHHVSLNYTIVGNCVLPTPSLFGSEPASLGTFGPMLEDEERGFALLNALSAPQRRQAVIHDVAPPDFVTRVIPKIGEEELPEDHELGFDNYVISDRDRELLKYIRSEAKGLPGADMDADQQQKLLGLIRGYVNRLPEDVADKAMERVQKAGLAGFAFAWAGKTEHGQPHYYRIQGPAFLVEFENAQRGAGLPGEGNHIHTVWRDPDNDFGDDVLLRHYEEAHLNPPMYVRRVSSSVPRGVTR